MGILQAPTTFRLHVCISFAILEQVVMLNQRGVVAQILKRDRKHRLHTLQLHCHILQHFVRNGQRRNYLLKVLPEHLDQVFFRHRLLQGIVMRIQVAFGVHF
jgi:hypothetical protein